MPTSSLLEADRFRLPLGSGTLTAALDTNDVPDDGYYVASYFNEIANLSSGPTYHLGEDWNGEGGGNTDLGDPVYAIANGEVVTVVDDQGSSTSGFGNYVVVRHDLTTPIIVDGQTVTHVYSLYAHLDSATYSDGASIKVGDAIGIGEQIGTLGNSGFAELANLHFEITLNDTLPTSDDGYNPSGAPSAWVDPSNFIESANTQIVSQTVTSPAKIGSELLVNTTTFDVQSHPDITSIGGGRFVVVWVDESDETYLNWKLQIFNSTGEKIGNEIAVNSSSQSTNFIGDYRDRGPSVSTIDDSKFIVTWVDSVQHERETSAQLFNVDGDKIGDLLRVPTGTSGTTAKASGLVNGNVIFIWNELGEVSGVYGQVFKLDGVPLDEKYLIGDAAFSFQSITRLADGRLVVVWEQPTTGDSLGPEKIMAQILNTDGTIQGTPIEVSTSLYYNNDSPVLSEIGNDNFVVVWKAYGVRVPGESYTVDYRAQIFDANGIKIHEEFSIAVLADSGSYAATPSVSALGSSHFIVTWDVNVGISSEIKAQIFDLVGNQVSDTFLVKSSEDGQPNSPDVTWIDDSRFVVAWGDFNSSRTENLSDIRAQIFDLNPLPNIWELTPITAVISEAGEELGFLLTRSDASIAETVYISTIQDQGHLNNNDYVGLLNTPIFFDVGVESQDVTLNVINDLLNESDETFRLIVQNSISDPVNVSLASTTFTIVDNDIEFPDLEGTVWNLLGEDAAAGTIYPGDLVFETQSLSPFFGYDLSGYFEWGGGGIFGTPTSIVYFNANIGFDDATLYFNDATLYSPVLASVAVNYEGEFSQDFLYLTGTGSWFGQDIISGNWTASLYVEPENLAPEATAINVSLNAGESIPLSSLFSWSDPDGINDIVAFAVRDRDIGGGYLTENDIKLVDGQLYDNIPIAEIGNWAFVAGETGSIGDIGFNVIDLAGEYSISSVASVEAVAPVGEGFSVVAANDKAVYLSTALGSIYAWSMTTGDTTLSAETGLALTDIAIAPDGRLFGITSEALYRIDPQTGESVVIGLLEATGELYYGVTALTDANGFDISPTGIARISSGNNTIVAFVDLETGRVSNDAGPLLQSGQASAGDLWYTSDSQYSLTTSTGTLVNAAPTTINGVPTGSEAVASSQFIATSNADGLIGAPEGAAGIAEGTIVGFVGQTVYELSPGHFALGSGLATLNLDGAVTGATVRRASADVPDNAIPQATGANQTISAGTSILLEDLFTWSDPDGLDDIVGFSVRDRDIGGGYLTENDIKLVDGQLYDNIPIAEIGNWAFVTGVAGSVDDVAFNAIDAAGAFSTPSSVATVTTAAVAPAGNASPTASGIDIILSPGETRSLDDLFDWDDPDGFLDVVSFSVMDATAGNGFIKDGLLSLTAGELNGPIPTSDITNLWFTAGPAGSSDDLQFTVTDANGKSSEPVNITISVDVGGAPTYIGTTDKTVDGWKTVDFLSQIEFEDPEGAADIDTIEIKYSDESIGFGTFFLDGNEVEPGGVDYPISISANELYRVALHMGPNDPSTFIQTRAVDKAGNISDWAEISINQISPLPSTLPGTKVYLFLDFDTPLDHEFSKKVSIKGDEYYETSKGKIQPLASFSDLKKKEIVSYTQQIFDQSNMSIIVTDSPPPSSGDKYLTVLFSPPHTSADTLNGIAYDITPLFAVGVLDRFDIKKDGHVAVTMDSSRLSVDIAETVAHEAAHAYGVEHQNPLVDNPTEIMDYEKIGANLGLFSIDDLKFSSEPHPIFVDPSDPNTQSNETQNSSYHIFRYVFGESDASLQAMDPAMKPGSIDLRFIEVVALKIELVTGPLVAINNLKVLMSFSGSDSEDHLPTASPLTPTLDGSVYELFLPVGSIIQVIGDFSDEGVPKEFVVGFGDINNPSFEFDPLTLILKGNIFVLDDFTGNLESIAEVTFSTRLAGVIDPEESNTAPFVLNELIVTEEDSPFTIKPIINDIDIDGDTLSLLSVTSGQNGVASDQGDGSIKYLPSTNFFGTDTFSYIVADGNGGTSSGTVEVTVLPVNDDPDAKNDSANTSESEAVKVTLLSNDTDVDGDFLIVTALDTTGTYGLVTDNGDGSFVYDPNGAFDFLDFGEFATDEFVYTVSDGNGGTDTATVAVTINGVDDAPIINPVTGTQASDYLVGTDEADSIRSLGGSYDKMAGGAGADEFVFGQEALNGIRERDVILDYEVDVDSIILANGASVGSIRQTSSSVVVFLEGDGDAIYVRGDGVTDDNLTIFTDAEFDFG